MAYFTHGSFISSIDSRVYWTHISPKNQLYFPLLNLICVPESRHKKASHIYVYLKHIEILKLVFSERNIVYVHFWTFTGYISCHSIEAQLIYEIFDGFHLNIFTNIPPMNMGLF